MTRARQAILIGSLLTAGCGSSSSGPGNAHDACAMYASSYCAQFESCTPGLDWLLGYTGMADCVSAMRVGCEAASASAHSGFTPSVINACANATAAQDCGTFMTADVPACSPRGGTLALGTSCLSDWQCSTGFCSGNLVTCGACAVALQEGDACDPNDSQCARDLVCGSSAADSSAPVCQKFVAIGASCGACPIGSYCARDTQRCVLAPKLSETCDPTLVFLCDPQSAAICDPTTSTCVAAPAVVQPGLSCDGNTRCAGNCVAQTDGSQLCQPYAQLGQPCDETQTFCAAGLTCDQGLCGTCGAAGTAAFEGAGAGRISPAVLARLPARLRDLRFGGLR